MKFYTRYDKTWPLEERYIMNKWIVSDMSYTNNQIVYSSTDVVNGYQHNIYIYTNKYLFIYNNYQWYTQGFSMGRGSNKVNVNLIP